MRALPALPGQSPAGLQDAVFSPNCPVPCPTDPADLNCPGGSCSLHRAGNKVGGGVEKCTYLAAGESPRYQGLPRCTQYLACGDELKGGDWSPQHGCVPWGLTPCP